jgi:hypothetical protein
VALEWPGLQQPADDRYDGVLSYDRPGHDEKLPFEKATAVCTLGQIGDQGQRASGTTGGFQSGGGWAQGRRDCVTA